MKKFVTLLLIISVMLLAACQSADLYSAQTEPQHTSTVPVTTSTTTPQPTATTTVIPATTVPTVPVESYTPVECTVQECVMLWVYRGWENTNWPVLITSTAQLEALLQDHFSANLTEAGRASYLEKFNDAFFAENSLVLVCVWGESGFSTCIVESCIRTDDGSYEIILKEPERSFGTGFDNYNFLFLQVVDVIAEDAHIHVELVESPHMRLIEN